MNTRSGRPSSSDAAQSHCTAGSSAEPASTQGRGLPCRTRLSLPPPAGHGQQHLGPGQLTANVRLWGRPVSRPPVRAGLHRSSTSGALARTTRQAARHSRFTARPGRQTPARSRQPARARLQTIGPSRPAGLGPTVRSRHPSGPGSKCWAPYLLSPQPLCVCSCHTVCGFFCFCSLL